MRRPSSPARFLFALCAPLAAPGCRGSTKDSGKPPTSSPAQARGWVEAGQPGAHAAAFDVDRGVLFAILDGAVQSSFDEGASWAPLSTEGLGPGSPTWVGAAEGIVLAELPGQGLVRWIGTSWVAPTTPPPAGLIQGLNPRAEVVPWSLAGDGEGTLWLSGAGGVFSSTDLGDTWTAATFGSAGFNLLFASAAADGDTVLAGAFAPRGLLPESYASLLSAVLLESDDGGATWTDAIGAADLRYISDLAIDDDGRAWLGALDGGLYERQDDGWVSSGGPGDALFVAPDPDGVSVASATRGLWRREDSRWTGIGDAPMVGLEDGFAMDREGRLFRLDEGATSSTAPAPAGGTVHIALSFHGNLYHSYRGDSNTEDGYGIDLEVMRTTLDWLGRHPTVHADWDIENHFSLDGWMQTDGADVLARIQQRVADGQDDVRLMSWNNGAMANHTRAEFDASISRAKDSLTAAFGGHVPGVQPQECMFTPDHIGWYRDQGIEWITLFHSATGFTALYPELELPEDSWYAPVEITDPQAAPDASPPSMTLVPVYHHADLINHGGLDGWARQLHENHSGDTLLVIHFDADAESWTTFEDELEAVQDAPYVEFTTIQDYLDEHAPVRTVDSPLDMADGTGDGFQSWAEKDFNHELATQIVRAREAVSRASAVAGDIPEVSARIEAALEPRLLALSTTHFGLAAPTLHPDRVDSARAFATEAEELGLVALEAALAEVEEPAATEVWLRETRGVAGTALVDVTVEVPAALWEGPAALHLLDEDDTPLVTRVDVVDEAADPVAVRLQLPVALEAWGQRRLRWTVDSAVAPATGGAALDDQPMSVLPVTLPFTECGGVGVEGAAEGPSGTVDDRGAVAQEELLWSLDLCDGVGVDNLRWTAQAWDSLPGVVLEVEAELPDATGGTATAEAPWNLDAESVALSPLACSSAADMLTWQTFSGSVRSRPVRPGQWTWNGQAIDSWVEIDCTEDDPIQLAHAAQERTSLAMLPLRTIDGQAVFAPLGTLWGPPIRHDVRRTGGHGMGDVSTAVIGSQFRPAAPDWSGKTVRYRLLVGAGELDRGTMELFAHPPLVQIGPAPTVELPAPD